MRQVLRAALVGVLGFVVLPLFAADEKKADDKKTDDKKAPEMVNVGTITGKILSVDETKRELKLQVSLREINPNEANGLAQGQADLQRALLERNLQSRAQKIQNAQNKIAQHTRNLYREKKVDVHYPATDDLKVRLNNPPPKFDEKGNVIKYTAKELKELKGEDTKTPGYPAEFSDLRQHQMVQVTLVKKKGAPQAAPKPDPNADKANKDVDKAAAAEAKAEFAEHMSMIVVIADAPVK